MYEPLSALSEEELDKATGLPRYIRRLTDKVLSAFNHAYAVGELEAAERLRDTLWSCPRTWCRSCWSLW